MNNKPETKYEELAMKKNPEIIVSDIEKIHDVRTVLIDNKSINFSATFTVILYKNETIATVSKDCTVEHRA